MKAIGKDFGWALTQMRAGCRARRAGWREDEWITLTGKKDDLINEDGSPCRFLDNKPLLATDWTVAPSPQEGGKQ